MFWLFSRNFNLFMIFYVLPQANNLKWTNKDVRNLRFSQFTHLYVFTQFDSKRFRSTGSAMGTKVLLFLEPKQPVVKQVSPSPNCSPSSNDWGICWLRVSGRIVVRRPDMRAITANSTTGTRGSNESWNIFFFLYSLQLTQNLLQDITRKTN